MKPGDRVYVRVGLDRHPVQGCLLSVDMAAGTGEVRIYGRVVQRALKRIHAKRPKCVRDRKWKGSQ